MTDELEQQAVTNLLTVDDSSLPWRVTRDGEEIVQGTKAEMCDVAVQLNREHRVRNFFRKLVGQGLLYRSMSVIWSVPYQEWSARGYMEALSHVHVAVSSKEQQNDQR